VFDLATTILPKDTSKLLLLIFATGRTEVFEMVLERLQKLWRRDESALGFDDPNAFRSGEYEDCFSCRVMGTND